MDNHCSPSQQDNYKKHKSCYDESGLYKIIESYNRTYPIKIDLRTATGKTKSFAVLWKELQKRLEAKCDQDEICWAAQLGVENDSNINKLLRPKKPIEWKKNPTTWLTNFNIEAVLIQYEESNKPFYKFLGVFSSNFLRKDGAGAETCYHRELCTIDIAKLYDAGTRTIGMVINLDEHDQPGSHWTSLFVCIDPTMSCFGAYYYDSTANNPPSDMVRFMKDLEDQGTKMKIKVPFKNSVNKIVQQYKNTECGVFSIYNQLKWLHEIKTGKKIRSFREIVSDTLNDDKMTILRDFLFRPIHIKK